MGQLEYVASGISHCRVTNEDATHPDVVAVYRKAFQEIVDNTEQDFSILYNAFTESEFPSKIEPYKDLLHTVHADSGGLQMITTGAKITPEIKNKIYRSQALHSDIGMCFDEIPVTISGDSSLRSQAENRYFDRDLLKEKASATGRNIFDQMKVYEDLGSDTKPMLICQGNDYDSFMKWTEYVMAEIPKNMHDRIGGVALSGAAHGFGQAEDYQRAFWFKHLPIDVKDPYLHILGLGAATRLIPYLTLMNNGYYDKNIRISYDSTTHMGGINMGKFFPSTKTLQLGRNFNPMYEDMFNTMNLNGLLDGVDVDLDLMYEIFNIATKYYRDENEKIDHEKMVKYYAVRAAYIGSSIRNFTMAVDKLNVKSNMIEFAAKRKLGGVLHSYNSVKTLDELEAFIRQNKKKLGTKPIANSVPTSLDELFG